MLATKDRYLSSRNTEERLFQEYIEYGKLIVAVDFDNTIYDCHGFGDTYQQVIDLLVECQDIATYFIFSASHPDRYPLIREHCESIGLPITGINESPIVLHGQTAKPFYSLLIDDRAGLESSFNALQKIKTIIDLLDGLKSKKGGA